MSGGAVYELEHCGPGMRLVPGSLDNADEEKIQRHLQRLVLWELK